MSYYNKIKKDKINIKFYLPLSAKYLCLSFFLLLEAKNSSSLRIRTVEM